LEDSIEIQDNDFEEEEVKDKVNNLSLHSKYSKHSHKNNKKLAKIVNTSFQICKQQNDFFEV